MLLIIRHFSRGLSLAFSHLIVVLRGARAWRMSVLGVVLQIHGRRLLRKILWASHPEHARVCCATHNIHHPTPVSRACFVLASPPTCAPLHCPKPLIRLLFRHYRVRLIRSLMISESYLLLHGILLISIWELSPTSGRIRPHSSRTKLLIFSSVATKLTRRIQSAGSAYFRTFWLCF